MERRLSVLNRHVFHPGTPIFKEGEPGDCAYFLERGRVQISRMVNGQSVTLDFIIPGGFFGEVALLDGGVRSASATAVEDTVLVPIFKHQLESKIETADPLVKILLDLLVQYIRRSNSLIGRV